MKIRLRKYRRFNFKFKISITKWDAHGDIPSHFSIRIYFYRYIFGIYLR